MCGRFTLRAPASRLATWFEDVDFPLLKPRYNIAPTQDVLILRSEQNLPRAAMVRWGLIPSWSQDTKIGSSLINARSETAATKPAFRSAFKHRRCVILADGFYEWKALPDGKQPFLIEPANVQRPVFCFAGLWERWTPKPVKQPSEPARSSPRHSTKQQTNLFADEPDPVPVPTVIETCSILTTAANEFMARLHDRMPVILGEAERDLWLNADFSEPDLLASLLRPCPDEWLKIQAVSKRVNKPTLDDETCVAEIKLDMDL